MQSIPLSMPIYKDVAGARLKRMLSAQRAVAMRARHHRISTDTIFDCHKQHIRLFLEAVLLRYLR